MPIVVPNDPVAAFNAMSAQGGVQRADRYAGDELQDDTEQQETAQTAHSQRAAAGAPLLLPGTRELSPDVDLEALQEGTRAPQGPGWRIYHPPEPRRPEGYVEQEYGASTNTARGQRAAGTPDAALRQLELARQAGQVSDEDAEAAETMLRVGGAPRFIRGSDGTITLGSASTGEPTAAQREQMAARDRAASNAKAQNEHKERLQAARIAVQAAERDAEMIGRAKTTQGPEYEAARAKVMMAYRDYMGIADQAPVGPAAEPGPADGTAGAAPGAGNWWTSPRSMANPKLPAAGAGPTGAPGGSQPMPRELVRRFLVENNMDKQKAMAAARRAGWDPTRIAP